MKNGFSGMGVVANKVSLCNDSKHGIYYHYTSLDTMWKIFDYETIRATQATFSNDSEEISKGLEFINNNCQEIFDKNLEKITIEELDRYIFCLCREGDKLSQWRAYCSTSGVSIGLAIDNFQTCEDPAYSCYIEGVEYCEIPIYPVYYLLDRNMLTGDIEHCISEENLKKILQEKYQEICKNEKNSIVLKRMILSVIPYIKHAGFYEEDEFRVIFENEGNKANGLIKYCLDEKTKINKPYVNLKFRLSEQDENEKDISKSRTKSIEDKATVWFFYSSSEKADVIERVKSELNKLDLKEFIIEDVKIEKEVEDQSTRLVISYTSEREQERVFHMIDEKINLSGNYECIPIWCLGHLPVRKIIVSPSIDQKQIINSIKHYCKHQKYWMKYVIVEGSKIPYRRPVQSVN